MHTLKRAPQKSQSFYLCSQCRHASTFRSLQERSYILRNRVHQARTARREDWALGPLAPNRIGNDDNYGCVEPTETKGIKNLDLVRKGRSPHMSKEMKWEDNMIEKGDRVVIIATEGPASRDRGKVGRVREVRKDRWEVMIDGLNMVGYEGFLSHRRRVWCRMRLLRLHTKITITWRYLHLLLVLTSSGPGRCQRPSLRTQPPVWNSTYSYCASANSPLCRPARLSSSSSRRDRRRW